MKFEDLVPNMTVEMRGEEYIYIVRYLTANQACLQDLATRKLFICDKGETWIEHLNIRVHPYL